MQHIITSPTTRHLMFHYNDWHTLTRISDINLTPFVHTSLTFPPIFTILYNITTTPYYNDCHNVYMPCHIMSCICMFMFWTPHGVHDWNWYIHYEPTTTPPHHITKHTHAKPYDTDIYTLHIITYAYTTTHTNAVHIPLHTTTTNHTMQNITHSPLQPTPLFTHTDDTHTRHTPTPLTYTNTYIQINTHSVDQFVVFASILIFHVRPCLFTHLTTLYWSLFTSTCHQHVDTKHHNTTFTHIQLHTQQTTPHLIHYYCGVYWKHTFHMLSHIECVCADVWLHAHNPSITHQHWYTPYWGDTSHLTLIQTHT